MAEKCFCHMTDPITGEKYTVKDAAARDSISDIHMTLSEHGLDIADLYNTIRGHRQKVLIDSPVDFHSTLMLNFNYEDAPDETTAATARTLPYFVRIFVVVGTNTSVKMCFPLDVTFPSRLPSAIEHQYIRSAYVNHSYDNSHSIYAQISIYKIDSALYNIVVKEINSSGQTTDCSGYITRIEAFY